MTAIKKGCNLCGSGVVEEPVHWNVDCREFLDAKTMILENAHGLK